MRMKPPRPARGTEWPGMSIGSPFLLNLEQTVKEEDHKDKKDGPAAAGAHEVAANDGAAGAQQVHHSRPSKVLGGP